MRKFEIGDRVKLIDNIYTDENGKEYELKCATLNHIYIIEKIKGCLIYIETDDKTIRGYSNYRFKLAIPYKRIIRGLSE